MRRLSSQGLLKQKDGLKWFIIVFILFFVPLIVANSLKFLLYGGWVSLVYEMMLTLISSAVTFYALRRASAVEQKYCAMTSTSSAKTDHFDNSIISSHVSLHTNPLSTTQESTTVKSVSQELEPQILNGSFGKFSRKPPMSQPMSSRRKVRSICPRQWTKGKTVSINNGCSVTRCFDNETGQIFIEKSKEVTVAQSESSAWIPTLVKEAECLQRFNHENIISYFGSRYEEIPGGVNNVTLKSTVIQEIGNQGSLRNIIDEFGSLPHAAIRSFTQQLLSALSYIHTAGIIHKDLKAANVVANASGIVKLIDFADSGPKAPGQNIVGSPFWLAPEVLNGNQHSPHSDIWALGCTVHEMLLRHPPFWEMFQGSHEQMTMQLLYKLASLTETHSLVPDNLPQDITDFLTICFNKNPRNRTSTTSLQRHPWIWGGASSSGGNLVPLNSSRTLETSVMSSSLSQTEADMDISLSTLHVAHFWLSTVRDSSRMCGIEQLINRGSRLPAVLQYSMKSFSPSFGHLRSAS
eukprot:TRINITY_DN18945_c0_g2_i2.p1 TRINITY_DN18945_c0_g2~~TRINITY_DN18945_c0_g2_i2.p1  ORF type:complete len:521 (+),score=55.60 TRINITY_DN18945_c0_g2_i2:119-1681(+)